MTRIRFELADGSIRVVDAGSDSLMRAAVLNDVEGIDAECGGSLSCATCHVYIAADDFDRLPRAEDEEMALLEALDEARRPGSRLSCQIMLEDAPDELTVTVPDHQI